MTSSVENEWLSLSEAAQVLGVHPGTVRHWSNQGVIPFHRTQGGHRRYKRTELELWKQSQSALTASEVDVLMQSALRNTRLQISEGVLQNQTWYNKLDEEAREQYRLSGRLLLQGLSRFLSTLEEEGKQQAQRIGSEYALRARRYGLSVVEAAQAFLFFRNNLIDSMLRVYEDAAVRSPHAWSQMFRRLNAYTDQIMTALLETYTNHTNGIP
ncbi:MAG: helix-turn-helix domain-containing protein [Anaerolineales bacterium]|nr:helix-turn-helix domain-containing protein [Anaerolineales bacterium]MCS7248904.1 helix-turn-helix domain-containing protein [Anaerolineales bacterium]MDW8162717.1 helix-turn-helix domain-containing protein [Anaerolineales bacterium]MDW8446676.1 helix-turn-helix domain-containing protein [Anaerolineales bacterium]